MTKTTIDWNTLSIDAWEMRFNRIPRSNILQSYGFARAHCPHARVRARWGLISFDGREAGLIQIFETGLLRNLIHGVMIDRGPIWFEGFGNAIHVKQVFDLLNKEFPKRFGRKRRILPETEDGPTARGLIAQTGLSRLEDRTGYQTIWLDLTCPLDALRANLRSNWRGHLSKAERAGLQMRWDDPGKALGDIIPLYAVDKALRDYGGPVPDFLKSYAAILAAKGDLLIGRLGDGANMEAFVVIACHGRAATYLAGWSAPSGREKSAHHLLLWQGVGMLQQRGIESFDLGGINDDENAQGIRQFKEGLGGRISRCVGHYV